LIIKKKLPSDPRLRRRTTFRGPFQGVGWKLPGRLKERENFWTARFKVWVVKGGTLRSRRGGWTPPKRQKAPKKAGPRPSSQQKTLRKNSQTFKSFEQVMSNFEEAKKGVNSTERGRLNKSPADHHSNPCAKNASRTNHPQAVRKSEGKRQPKWGGDSPSSRAPFGERFKLLSPNNLQD